MHAEQDASCRCRLSLYYQQHSQPGLQRAPRSAVLVVAVVLVAACSGTAGGETDLRGQQIEGFAVWSRNEQEIHMGGRGVRATDGSVGYSSAGSRAATELDARLPPIAPSVNDGDRRRDD